MSDIRTTSIGPTEQSATNPNEFSFPFLPPKVVAIPTPNAIINGTVIGPVVTPPESNASGKSDHLSISISNLSLCFLNTFGDIWSQVAQLST